MAYPLTQMPTLGDFIARMTSEYGAIIQTHDGKVEANGCDLAEIKSISISKDGKRSTFAIIPNVNDNEVLTPDVLRSLCKQLDIPPKDFGLYLD